jgi:Kef-type K+ transport system membrane component KefB
MNNNLQIFIEVLRAIIVILIVSKLIGQLFVLVGQPKVVGEMMAGVLLGPTCLGFFFPQFSGELFKRELMPFIFVLSNMGLSVYMFLIALEMDFTGIDRKALRQSFTMSFLVIIVPMGLGIFAGILFFNELRGAQANLFAFSLFLGCALAITAFPTLARILEEKGLVKTKLGAVSLLSASIQDIVSWVLLAFVTASAAKTTTSAASRALIGGVLFTVIMYWPVKFIIRWLYKMVKSGLVSRETYFSILVLSLLLSALVTDYIGLYSVFGGFMLGLIVPRDESAVNDIVIRLREITTVLFIPLFFSFSGLNANFLALKNLHYLVPALAIILFASSKYLVTTLVMRVNGFSWQQASAAGGLMNARGLMELIIANIGLIYGVISAAMYSILVLVAVVSTLTAVPIYNVSMNYSKKVRLPYPDGRRKKGKIYS